MFCVRRFSYQLFMAKSWKIYDPIIFYSKIKNCDFEPMCLHILGRLIPQFNMGLIVLVLASNVIIYQILLFFLFCVFSWRILVDYSWNVYPRTFLSAFLKWFFAYSSVRPLWHNNHLILEPIEWHFTLDSCMTQPFVETTKSNPLFVYTSQALITTLPITSDNPCAYQRLVTSVTDLVVNFLLKIIYAFFMMPYSVFHQTLLMISWTPDKRNNLTVFGCLIYWEKIQTNCA